jgi:hypothetical protein
LIEKKKIGDHCVAQIFSLPRGTFTPKPHARCPVAARGLSTPRVQSIIHAILQFQNAIYFIAVCACCMRLVAIIYSKIAAKTGFEYPADFKRN